MFLGYFGALSRKSSGDSFLSDSKVPGESFLDHLGAWSRKYSEMVSGGRFWIILERGREIRLKLCLEGGFKVILEPGRESRLESRF